MRIRLLCLLAALPLLCAAGFTRPVWGTLKFGMTEKEAADAIDHNLHHSFSASWATGIRQSFITNTIRVPGKRMAMDSKLHIVVEFKADPLVTEIIVKDTGSFDQDYNSVSTSFWQDFQDIGDSKFNRIGKAVGIFPTLDQFAIQADQEIVTDEWEAEGVRVQLLVRRVEKVVRDGVRAVFYVELKATEIASARAK